MPLHTVFSKVRRSIVAFASTSIVRRSRSAPPFPRIVGTGFLVDDRGLAITNRHVVRALERLPTDPKTRRSSAVALAFSDVTAEPGSDKYSMQVVVVGLRRWDKLTTLTSDARFYGEQLPDLAFVQLNASGLPSSTLETAHGSWEVGRSVATAGFPLGNRALAIYGRINQAMPILRQGVIASVYPFPNPRPHGFTVDIMTLGGESGSPIFDTHEGKVLGLLHAGFNGTNITLAIPSWFLAEAFQQYLQKAPLDFANLPPFSELVEQAKADPLKWEAV